MKFVNGVAIKKGGPECFLLETSGGDSGATSSLLPPSSPHQTSLDQSLWPS